MSALSEKERLVYDYIVKRLSGSVAPTVREICVDLGIKSTSSAHRYLKSLEQKGLIQSSGHRNRTIRLRSMGAAYVPLVGTITAGSPILAIEQIEDYIPFRASEAETLFALRVKGDSMRGAAILDGDIIVVRRTPTVENGEIAAVLIDEDATVKRFYREDGMFRLQPENPDYAPIVVPEVVLLGRVIAVIRNL